MDIINSIQGLFTEFNINSILSNVLLRLSLILFGFIAIVWLFVQLRKKNTFLAYKTENGSVSVSKNAISDLIRQICHNNHGISLIKAQLKKKKQWLDLQIFIRIEGGGQLKAIEQSLQLSIREALQETFGIESIRRINLVASSIKAIKNHSPIVEE